MHDLPHRTPMSVRLITIDFWNTLVDSSNGEGRNQHRAETMLAEAERLGRTLSIEDVHEAGHQAWAFFRHLWLEEQRTPQTDEMVLHMWATLEMPADPEAVQRVTEVYRRGILLHPPSVLPGVAAALPRLAESFELAIVSDTAVSSGEVLREVLANAGLLRFFSHFSFSDETGVAKPHPKAFYRVLEAAGVDPTGALHIGDIERTDIDGARNLGMEAILYAGDHGNSVVKSDVTSTRARMVAHHWDQITEALLDGHIWRM